MSCAVQGMTHALDDAQLVAQAQHGDIESFEVLVRRHHTQVYRIALRMLGNSADAEDATQEIFIDTWRALPGFQGRSSFATWLYRIVIRRSLKVRRTFRPTASLGDDHEGYRTDRPDHTLLTRETTEALNKAIAELPEEQRVALVLREFEELSYDRLAEVLGITEAAVKGRLYRARRGLMEAMREWA